MLIFDIETLQYAGFTDVWDFGAIDTVTGKEYHYLNWSIIKKAETWIRSNRAVNFFDINQLSYAKTVKTAKRLNKRNFITHVQNCLDEHKAIAAYNIAFDVRELQKYGVHFKRRTKQVCLWGSAINAFVNHRYIKWCYENEYLSEKGNIQTNAETMYKYLSGDDTYDHQHFALSDCQSEAYIWERIKTRKQKLERRTSYANVRKKVKELGY